MADHGSAIPKGKETVLGLYATAAEAYQKWKAEPGKVSLFDVRTPEEFLFVGHPPMAWKISILLAERQARAINGKLGRRGREAE